MIKITWIQIFATLFQLITSTSGLCNETNVGVRDELQVITDDQMTASTNKGTDFLPKFGRLLGTNAWCPNITDNDPYLEIDLGQKYDICAVEVQGEPGASIITNFTLSTSTGDVMPTFTEYNSGQQFNGSEADGDTPDFHELTPIIKARHIRFEPVTASTCLRVEVYGTPEGVTVTCNENDMQVEIDRSIQTGFTDPIDLRLRDSSCNSSFNNASVINFDITLGTCDTTVVISNDGMKSFYLNEINNSTGDTEFNIICSYIREPTVFDPGDGSFSFAMNIFTDASFTTPVPDSAISLGTNLYFKIDVQSSDANTELHLTKCLATPTSSPSDPDGYTFIENGCDVESDTDFVSGYDCLKSDNFQTFTLSVFRFASSAPGSLIYFHCDAVVCLTSNAGSVCRSECSGCVSERSRRALEGNSKKDLAEAHLVRGPYRIIDKDEENSDKVPNDDDSHDEDPTKPIEDSNNFPVTLVIVVCVSASVAMAIIIGLLVSIRLAQNARGPAVKDVTVDLARDNLAFDELDIKTLSMKSNEKPI